MNTIDSNFRSLLLSKVGGPQISFADPQISGLKMFVRFADLPQMLHLIDLKFVDPIFFVICGLKTSASPRMKKKKFEFDLRTGTPVKFAIAE
jgi:hypothetical protein